MIKLNQNRSLGSPEKTYVNHLFIAYMNYFVSGLPIHIGNSTFFCTFVPEFIRKLAKRLLYLFHILRKL